MADPIQITGTALVAQTGMFAGITEGVAWATVFTILGAALGIAALLGAVALIPRIVNRFTPHIDEEAEIIRGNRAVAEYFGRVVSATILGVSIIIAAAIIAGIHG